jgi:predicted GNAT superfamily acetyltransferase
MPDYLIREFDSVEDHHACVELQKRVWVGDDAVPSNITITIQRHGGLALGAFDTTTGRMIGFVLSLLSQSHHAGANRGLSHHSHIAAVEAERQGVGIGEALKRAQAEQCKSRGINLITWTFDPLESKNARLNIGKLGCICRTYIRNCYGEMQDVLNKGLPSDRFEVEWWLDKDARGATQSNLPERSASRGSKSKDDLQIEIPRDFQEIKKRDLKEALDIRLKTREQFERAFDEGYVVVDFTLLLERAYYSLTQCSPNPPTHRTITSQKIRRHRQGLSRR